MSKILIIAYPELAASLKEALSDAAEIFIPEFLEEIALSAETTAAQSLIPTSRQLFEAIFANPTKQDKEENLFTWREYDFVIIQDLWISSDELAPINLTEESEIKHSGTVFAGYILAHSCYYLWGNFQTKFIILVTDKKTLPLLSAPSNDNSANTNNYYSLVTEFFDEKNAFELVDLVPENSPHPGPDPIGLLKEIISGNINRRESFDNNPQWSEKLNVDKEYLTRLLQIPVMNQIKNALRSYVETHAEIIYIDDEIGELKRVFYELTGKVIETNQIGERRSVEVACSKSKEIRMNSNFRELLQTCEKLKKLVEGDKFTIFITDILFKIPSWNESGIDLIEYLRNQFVKNRNSKIGIIAFTGFTTPFVSMFAYQKGADFVVSKNTAEQRSTHSTLANAGSDQLLMAVAFLCFQRNYIRSMRNKAISFIKNMISVPQIPTDLLEIERFSESFRNILPVHSVSQHLKEDWENATYLFESIKLYHNSTENLKEILSKNV